MCINFPVRLQPIRVNPFPPLTLCRKQLLSVGDNEHQPRASSRESLSYMWLYFIYVLYLDHTV